MDITESDKKIVYSWLRDFNHAQNSKFWQSLETEGTAIPIFICERDDAGDIIGGLEGLILHKWLRISIMAVDPSNRRNGVGTDLVARAENLAMQHGCRYAFVDTMSYQAPGFYERLDYRLVGQIPDWDSHGHDKLYFAKDLAA